MGACRPFDRDLRIMHFDDSADASRPRYFGVDVAPVANQIRMGNALLTNYLCMSVMDCPFQGSS